MFFMFFFYLQINVFNIYGKKYKRVTTLRFTVYFLVFQATW